MVERLHAGGVQPKAFGPHAGSAAERLNVAAMRRQVLEDPRREAPFAAVVADQGALRLIRPPPARATIAHHIGRPGMNPRRLALTALAAIGLFVVTVFMSAGIAAIATPTGSDSNLAKSSDIASWVQALGSIIAIFVSYLLGMRQANSMHESALALERQRQARREEGSYRVQIRLLDTCDQAVQWMADAGTVQRFTAIWDEIHSPSLSAAIRAFDSIPLFDAYPMEQINTAFTIRDVADQVARQGGRACSPPPPALNQREFLAMKNRTEYFQRRLAGLRRRLLPPTS